jgi:TonB-dependent receptor
MIVPTLKAGYFGEWKDRDFTARNIGYITGSQFSTYPDSILYQPIDQVFSQQNLDYNSKISIAEQTNKSDSYKVNNKLIAGYLSLNIPLFYKINIYGGVRMENNELHLSSYRQDQPDIPVNVNNKKLNLFPSANISFNISKKTLLRLAYSRSVNRPEFREIAPYYFVDFDRNASFRGNPDLKDADIQNIDIRFEHYPSNGETFSLALFYKKFVNPIEAVVSNEGSGKSFTYANAAGAVNYGAELDVRKALANQGFLQNISVVANGSIIKSLVKFEGDESKKSHDRPLQGQSPYIANVGLFYNQPKQGLTISALYNVIGKRIYAVGIVNQNSDSDIPDEYEMPRNVIDLTIVKKIGRLIEIKLGIKDLLNQPVEYRQTFKFTDKNGSAQERIGKTNYYYPGSVYSIGVSLKL